MFANALRQKISNFIYEYFPFAFSLTAAQFLNQKSHYALGHAISLIIYRLHTRNMCEETVEIVVFLSFSLNEIVQFSFQVVENDRIL